MSKLTNDESQRHQRACALLEQDALTFDERVFVLDHWRADANHMVGTAGAFFTPSGLARAFADECNGAARVIDLCAGIGSLAFWRWQRDRAEIVCVEANPVYMAVGRKVLPEATWIEADVFALPDVGRFDLAVSNPPYGRVPRSADGPCYRGGLFEYHVIDIASRLADQGAFLIPQASAGFRWGGSETGYTRITSKEHERFLQHTGITLAPGLGIDTSFWREDWQGVRPVVESVRVDFQTMECIASVCPNGHGFHSDLQIFRP